MQIRFVMFSWKKSTGQGLIYSVIVKLEAGNWNLQIESVLNDPTRWPRFCPSLLWWHVSVQVMWNRIEAHRIHETTELTWWRHQMEIFSALLVLWVRGNSPVTGESQRRGALMFSLIWAWTNSWVNNRDAGDLRRNRAHYDVIVMKVQAAHGMETPAVLLIICMQWL